MITVQRRHTKAAAAVSVPLRLERVRYPIAVYNNAWIYIRGRGD